MTCSRLNRNGVDVVAEIVAHPFMVDFYYHHSGLPGGWHSRREWYATKEEAIAAIEKPFMPATFKATVTRVIEPENWPRAKMMRLASRERDKDIHIVKRPRVS